MYWQQPTARLPRPYFAQGYTLASSITMAMRRRNGATRLPTVAHDNWLSRVGGRQLSKSVAHEQQPAFQRIALFFIGEAEPPIERHVARALDRDDVDTFDLSTS